MTGIWQHKRNWENTSQLALSSSRCHGKIVKNGCNPIIELYFRVFFITTSALNHQVNEVEAAVDMALKQFSRIDILVNGKPV